MFNALEKLAPLIAAVALTTLSLGGCGGSPSPTPSAGTPAPAAPGVVIPDITAAWNYIKASSAGAHRFGHSVALSADGTTLAIGARTESSNATGVNGDASNTSANTAGAVYVFTRSGSNWVFQAYIKASNTAALDEFGFSVALSETGDTLAVGAIGESSKDSNPNDDSLNSAGAVYVFQRTAGNWSQQAYVKAEHTGDSDQFGYSVALSGDGHTLAVGAILEDGTAADPTDNTHDDAGAVYVFARNTVTNAWTQQAYVKAGNSDLSDRFGHSLALSKDGKTLAVGAVFEDGDGSSPTNNAYDDAGAVYVFTRDLADVWTQEAYVKASNANMSDQFGVSLALSGDGKTLAVGALGEDGNGSAPSDDSLNDAGAVYVFTRDAADAWTERSYLKASNAGLDDRFGRSVALSHDGTVLAVGAHWENSNATGFNGNQADDSADDAGAVYAFLRNSGNTWSQVAYIKATHADAFDEFGAAVALAGDGRTLAVGAPGEASQATGVNGDQTLNALFNAGAVYVQSIPLN